MLVYVLKSAACLAILLAFYTFFMEKENMHTLKRFYLLGALVAALTIPFVTFVEYVEITVPTEATMEVIEIPAMTSHVQEQTPIDYLPIVLLSMYLLGALLFGFKFIRNLAVITQRIRKNPKYRVHHIYNVLLSESIVPHTFLSYIFLNKHKFEARQIPKEVLLHEETHAKQKHSWDVLFVEFLQVIFWFNPLMHLVKKAIKLNHEFLADRAVLNKGYEPATYQNTLLEFSSNSLHPQLANAINYSSIKKRFTVMKTKTSKNFVVVISALVLPLFGLLLFSFSETEVIQTQQSETQISSEQIAPFQTDLKEKDKYYEKVTFKFKDENGEVNRHAKYSDLTLEEKYNLIPPPSTPLESKRPSQKDMDYWKDKDKYGIWVDGKSIDNDKLSDYKPNDFGTFFVSNLEKNAKNYEKHFYQINLYSNNEFKKQSLDILQPLDEGVEIYMPHKFTGQTKANKGNVKKEKLVPFVVSVQKNKNSIRLKCNSGCRWADIILDYTKRSNYIINDFGFSEGKTLKIDKFAFIVEPSESGVSLTGLKGTAWIELNFSLNKNQKQLINEKGMISLKRDKSPEAPLQEGATKRQVHSIPPPPPPYKVPEQGKNYSNKLLKALDKFEKAGDAYGKAVATHKKKGGNTVNSLNKMYEELMVLYNNYVELAIEEKLMTPRPPQPIKVLQNKWSHVPPPPPPSSPSPVNGEIIEIPSPSANPNVPNGEIQEVPPPPIPLIKPPTERTKYSDELLDAFDKLMEKGNLYGQAGIAHSKKGKGSIKDLQQKYKEVMKLYEHYVNLAVKENLMAPTYSKPRKIKKGDRSNIPPPPPPSHVDGEIKEVPAPPPAPKSPEDHVMEMAEKNAIFYYEGKEISSDKAIKILKKSKKINLRTRHERLIRPIVELSTQSYFRPIPNN